MVLFIFSRGLQKPAFLLPRNVKWGMLPVLSPVSRVCGTSAMQDGQQSTRPCLPTNGCGSKLNDRRGKPQVLVHVSTCQGRFHFGTFRFFVPHSFQASFFSGNHQNPGETVPVFEKRTMVAKNGWDQPLDLWLWKGSHKENQPVGGSHEKTHFHLDFCQLMGFPYETTS